MVIPDTYPILKSLTELMEDLIFEKSPSQVMCRPDYIGPNKMYSSENQNKVGKPCFQNAHVAEKRSDTKWEWFVTRQDLGIRMLLDSAMPTISIKRIVYCKY